MRYILHCVLVCKVRWTRDRKIIRTTMAAECINPLVIFFHISVFHFSRFGMEQISFFPSPTKIKIVDLQYNTTSRTCGNSTACVCYLNWKPVPPPLTGFPPPPPPTDMYRWTYGKGRPIEHLEAVAMLLITPTEAPSLR